MASLACFSLSSNQLNLPIKVVLGAEFQEFNWTVHLCLRFGDHHEMKSYQDIGSLLSTIDIWSRTILCMVYLVGCLAASLACVSTSLKNISRLGGQNIPSPHLREPLH